MNSNLHQLRSKKNEEITFLAGDACLYSVVRKSAISLGWKLIGENAPEKVKRNCHVIWVDRSFVNDKLFLSIQPWQRINHFPGMTNICRKTRLAQSLELMKKKFPREYSFYPTTYVLPQNFAAFKALFASNGQSKGTYIIKPDGSAQGKGIFLTKNIENVENLNMMCVAQQYIRDPLLIDKKKFDLRIYVLTTSCSPLRIYLARDGLVRICTEEYNRPNSSNMDDMCMHLTNYAVNKRSDKYERDEGSIPDNMGSKRSISWLMACLEKERGKAATDALWARIGDICVMTIMSILPTLRREYDSIFGKKYNKNDPDSLFCPSGNAARIPGSIPGSERANQGKGYECNDGDLSMPIIPETSDERLNLQEDCLNGEQAYHDGDSSENDTVGKSRCFEILGIDIMIDNDLRPHLIEVNHLPSWGTDSPLDELIKSRVIVQALSATKVNAHEKRYYEDQERKKSRIRLRRNQDSTDCDCGEIDAEIENQNPDGMFDETIKKKKPVLYESNSAERRIRLMYEKYAPEKLSNLKHLLNRFRGYEEWLAMKVEEKYNHSSRRADSNDLDEQSASSNENDCPSGAAEMSSSVNGEEYAKFEEEERILEDYDRIYPPPSTGRISASRYREMEKFITEMDEKQQSRLLRPLHQLRPTCDDDANVSSYSRRRSDGWIGGNIHTRSAKEEVKLVGPPSKKQVEFADRLSRGFSVGDAEIDKSYVKRKPRTFHEEYAEINPFYQLIDRVRQSREFSKEARRRAEMKLNRRLETGTALKQQTIELGLDSSFIETHETSKFYTKKRCHYL